MSYCTRPRIWNRGCTGMMEVCVQGSGCEVVKARTATIKVGAVGSIFITHTSNPSYVHSKEAKSASL
jgi:hypothetical protein